MRALVVTVPSDEVDVASDRLWTLGVLAIEERRCADGSVELWTSLDGEDPVGMSWPWRHQHVDDEVVDSWRAHAVPTFVTSEVVIVPAWVEAPSAELVVRVEPASSFGLGDHPTTVLTARALLADLEPGDRVLDVGCGSGVLAVLAAMSGARHVEAIDISVAAVAATLANAGLNHVEVAASTMPLAAVAGRFDVVVANILAPTLIELAPHLQRLTARRLVVSGLLSSNWTHVAEALEPMSVERVDELDGWVALSVSAVP